MPPLVMNTFWPFSTQSSPSRPARVRRAETSEPAPDSVTHTRRPWARPVPNSSGPTGELLRGAVGERATRGRPAAQMPREMPAHPQQVSSTSDGLEDAGLVLADLQ